MCWLSTEICGTSKAPSCTVPQDLGNELSVAITTATVYSHLKRVYGWENTPDIFIKIGRPTTIPSVYIYNYISHTEILSTFVYLFDRYSMCFFSRSCSNFGRTLRNGVTTVQLVSYQHFCYTFVVFLQNKSSNILEGRTSWEVLASLSLFNHATLPHEIPSFWTVSNKANYGRWTA